MKASFTVIETAAVLVAVGRIRCDHLVFIGRILSGSFHRRIGVTKAKERIKKELGRGLKLRAPRASIHLCISCERYYDEQIRAGAVIARADKLFELHEPKLPLLAHGVHWTPLLITSLLADERRVRFRGQLPCIVR